MNAGAVAATPTVWRDFPATARRMVEIIKDASRDPDIRAAAIEIIRPAASGFYVNEARLLFEHFRDLIKYVGDPTNEDVFQWPLLTLRNRAADCNNRVLALGALARSIGFPVRLAFAFDPDAGDENGGAYPAHVWLELEVSKDEEAPIWIPLETTPTRDPAALATNVFVPFGAAFPVSGKVVRVNVED